MSVQSCLVLVIAGTAVLMDFLMEKVINSFICLGLLAGFVTCLQEEGIRGIPVYAAGVLIPCVLHFAFVLFSYAGGGSIKVFAVLGGLTGSHGIYPIMFGSFLLWAVLSLAFCFLRESKRNASLIFFTTFISIL